MNVITRGIRNAFRNVIRTFSIVFILGLSIGLSLTMLVAHQAVGQKINSVKGTVGNTISVSPAGFSGFSQVNNALSTSQLSSLKSVAHVTSVTETLTDRLTTIGSSQPSFGGRDNSSSTDTNNQTSLTSPVTIKFGQNGGSGRGEGRVFVSGGGALPTNFSPPVSIVGTSDPSTVQETTLTISSGTAISGSADTNDAMVSSSMASKNNLKVGSTFTAYGQTLTVKAIFKGGTQATDGIVVVSLPTEQRLSAQGDVVDSATVNVDSVDNLASTTTAIKHKLGSTADVVNASERAQQAVAPLQNIQTISVYSLIGAVVAGSVIILLTMIMIVRERRREIGVLKAIGASNLKVVSQFMAEAVTLTGLGAVIGIVLGAIAGNPITRLLVSNNTSGGPGGAGLAGGRGGGFVTRGLGGVGRGIDNIHAVVGWSIIAYGLLAAIVIALVGSALASFFISKIRPAEVLRTE